MAVKKDALRLTSVWSIHFVSSRPKDLLEHHGGEFSGIAFGPP